MSLSLHDASIPVFIHGLRQLEHLLDKAQAHAKAIGSDPESLIDARLADDMLALSGQIQRASDTAKFSAERLFGVTSPKMPDTERSVGELRSRIGATIAFLQSIDPAHIGPPADSDVILEAGQWKAAFTPQAYLLQFALPNFQFHVVTAYAILRHAGVPLGKLDFIGRVGRPITT